MTILQTERTVIDRISLDDAPFFAELLSSPGWIRFIGRDVSDEKAVEEYLRNGFLRSYRKNGFGYYIVRTASQRLPIGICGFLKRAELENPDFGFALLPEFMGFGYAFESSQAVLGYGISQFDFEVLDAVTTPENLRSIRLLEKLGFCRIDAAVPVDTTDEPLELYRWSVEEVADDSRPIVIARR